MMLIMKIRSDGTNEFTAFTGRPTESGSEALRKDLLQKILSQDWQVNRAQKKLV